MSAETMEWLNTHTLIGFTENRGDAWHYREELQGEESNHYPGAIPVGDVDRRLFFWTPQVVAMEYTIPEYMDLSGVYPERRIIAANRKIIVHPHSGADLGVFRGGYQVHGYSEWGIGVMSNLVGDTLKVESAGLLRGGAVAWVQISVAENVKTKHGYDFRPHLTFYTSLDGTLPTTYKLMATAVVCDNTLAAGMGERTPQIRVKHTLNSGLRIPEARDAFNLIEHESDVLNSRIDKWTSKRVTKKQFSDFLDMWSPITEDMSKNKVTRSEARREQLTALYNGDKRVEPWRGTAFAILQALNTYDQHFAQIHNPADENIGLVRAERAMMNGLTGKLDDNTADYVRMVEAVLA